MEVSQGACLKCSFLHLAINSQYSKKILDKITALPSSESKFLTPFQLPGTGKLALPKPNSHPARNPTTGGGDQETGSEGGQEIRKEGGWGWRKEEEVEKGEESLFIPFYSDLPKNVGLSWGWKYKIHD